MKLRPMPIVIVTIAFSLLALAASAPAKPTSKATVASVTVAAPTSAAHGARISFRVISLFGGRANGAEHLTVFISPPGVACPKGVLRPRGADSLLSAEPADQVLIANVISDRLQRRGDWSVCGYLTYGRTITARAQARVRVA